MVTEDSIEKFKNEYKGGEEEKRDLLEAYNNFKGNMNQIYQVVMLSDPLEDDDRFRSIINAAIADKTVEPEKAYTEESMKSRQSRIDEARKRAQKEEKEALKYGEDLKKNKKKAGAPDSLGDLAALIQQRQKGRASNFLDNLEAKYAPKGKKGKRAAPMDEPPEEAFQRTSSRFKKGKK